MGVQAVNVFLALIGLPLTLLLPGLCTVAALAPHRRLDWPERIYLALAISLTLSGWIGLILAQLGCFSASLLLGLLALYSLALGLLAWRRGRWRWPRPEGPPEHRWVLPTFLVLALLSGLLTFRPFELIIGPRDAAVYPATGMQIARHGSTYIRDPLIPTLERTNSDEQHWLWVNFFGVLPRGRHYYHYLRMPGFSIVEAETENQVLVPQFISDAEQGIVVPQFYPLYPTWLAVAFSLLGLKAGLLMTPYLSFLGGVGVYLVARRLFGPLVASGAYLFLGLNLLQVWFGRYSTAEGATQFLLFLCLYALVRLEEDDSSRRDPFFGLLAGVALGLIGLVRVEFIFPWLLFLPYLGYLYVSRNFARGHRLLLISTGVLAVHTLVLFVTYTRDYTLHIYYHRIQDWFTLSWSAYPFLTPALREYFVDSPTPRTMVMRQPWRLAYELGIPLLLLGLLVFLRRAPHLVRQIGAWLRRHRLLLLALATGLFLALFAYAYLVRPGILSPQVLLHPLENRAVLEGYIGAPVPEGREANLVRLGWYLSPLGMLLAFAGIAGLILRESSRRSWFLLLLGAFYLFLFTYEVYGMDHHVYIMRRYVAMVLPFLSIAMAYALVWLARARWARLVGKIVAAGVGTLLVLFFVYTGWPFFRHNEYQGAIEQVGSLARRFEPQDILLIADDGRDTPFTIGTPLQYLFDRNVLGIYAANPDGARIEAQIRRWKAEGRQVYLLAGNGGGRLFLPHTRPIWLDRFELAVPEFEQLTTQKPHNAYILRQPFGIYSLEPGEGPDSPLGPLPVTVDLGQDGYIYQASGFYRDEVTPDGTTYCWTKGEITGTLRLPWPEENEQATITLRLAGGRRAAELGPARVEVYLGERQMASLELAEGFATYTVSLRAGEVAPEQGTVFLKLASTSWKQVDYGLGGDPRPLGVQVDWVRVEVAR